MKRNPLFIETKDRFCIMSNDGRYVTQHGTIPALTSNRNLAYCWDTAEEARVRLPRYLSALKSEEVLALAVMAYRKDA